MAVLFFSMAVQAALGLADLPQLETLERPVLDGMSEEVQKELGTRFEELTTLVERPATDPPELAQHFGDLGGLYFLYGLFSHAEPALRNAMALDPADFRWPYLLGFASQSEGLLDGAAGLLERALKLKPDYLAALIRLGNLRLDELRLEEARALFQRALDINESAAAARVGLGRAAIESGDAAAAAEQFEAALALQPGATAIHYPLALAYRTLGQSAKVERHLAAYGAQQVAVPDPVTRRLRGLATGSAVSFVRGQRALSSGDYRAAVELFRSAKTADPESAPVQRALGLALRRLGDVDAAIAEYRIAVELEPANPLNHQDLALALSVAGRFQEAENHFRRATELDATFAEAYLGLGIAVARQSRPGDALPVFEQALSLDPMNTSARFERAMTLTQLQETVAARQELEKILDAEPDHLPARINLARLLELEGNLAEAQRQSRRALTQLPPPGSEARLRLILGRVAERRGALDVAASEYGRATQLAPALAPAHLRLASTKARAGDFTQAAESYGRALRLTPRHHAARLAQASSWILAARYREARTTLDEGLELDPANAALAAELAVLLAGCPDDSVRDPDRSLANARHAFRSFNNAFSGQVLALALAATDRFEEATRAQGRIIAGLESVGATVSGAARSRLDQFRAGLSPRAPWLDDPLLLAPAALPLAGRDGPE